DDGVTSGGVSAVGNTYLFTGRRLDGETELYYYRARYMNTEQGRFLSRDSLQPPNSPNLYEYPLPSPGNRVDPEGMKVRYPGWINCLGYAIGESASVTPKAGEDSFKEMMKKLGWDCERQARGTKSKECKCKCPELMLMLYIYSYPNNMKNGK